MFDFSAHGLLDIKAFLTSDRNFVTVGAAEAHPHLAHASLD